MSWNSLSGKWQQYFIDQLHRTTSMSEDANTKVAAMIIDTEDKVVVSVGYNCLPRGVKHSQERSERPKKYYYISHAEVSCLTNALRLNVAVKGLTMLVNLGCCPSCTCSIINSGIKEVVTPELDYEHISCGDVYQHSVAMMQEAGVNWVFDNNLRVKESKVNLPELSSTWKHTKYGKVGKVFATALNTVIVKYDSGIIGTYTDKGFYNNFIEVNKTK